MNRFVNGSNLSALLIGAVALILSAPANAMQSQTLHPTKVISVTPQIVGPLSQMHNLGLRPTLRRIVGNAPMSQAALAQLKQKLIESGDLPSSDQHFSVPLLSRRPFLPSAPVARDPVVQKAMPALAPSALSFIVPIVSFSGQGWSSNQSPAVVPPDTNAAAGPNDVVEITNLSYPSVGVFTVYAKNGNVLLGPVNMGTLWSSGICRTSGLGDVVVLYDQLAHRWVLSQFAGSVVPTDECVMVSKTSDPTGTYYTYDFPVYPNDFGDYPKLGIWPNAYYASFNVFNAAGTAYVGDGFVAFDRSAMLQGKTARMVQFLSTNDYAYSVLPASLDGDYTPPAGAPGIFLDFVSPHSWGINYYALDMWQMTVNWASPTYSILTGPTVIPVAPFNDQVCYNQRVCIPQPPPANNTEYLDAISDRLMYRLAYRNLVNASTPHQALVVNQTVGTGYPAFPPTGIRWYELDAPEGSIDASQWTVAQQSTYQPNDGASRWMGSIAMDADGDIALGYSKSSTTIFPSVDYTGRLASDPPNVMTQPETSLVAGAGSQEANTGRWGDYSSMAVAPNGCTFWYAQEYYNQSNIYKWSTRLGSFKFANCVSPPSGTLNGTVTAAASGSAIQSAHVSMDDGSGTVTNNNGQYSLALPPGTYTEAVSDYGYTTQTQSVAITNGGTSTQNFQLAAAPSTTVSGTVTDGSGHGYGLYAEVKVSVPGVGRVKTVWTNPANGKYSVSLPEGSSYTFIVDPSQYMQGYKSATGSISNLSGATTKNFTLDIDSSCTAPGYVLNFAENFNGSIFPPSGWTVNTPVNNGFTYWALNTHWHSNVGASEGNYTGGSGTAAAVDSNYAGRHGPFNTQLISPPIPVTSLPANPILTYKANYQFYGQSELRLSINNGSGWSLISNWNSSAYNCGNLYSTPGCTTSVDLTPYMPSSGSITLRWDYQDLSLTAFDWYAQIDDVDIGTCHPVSGGLVVGQVTDANTGKGLVNASVSDDSGSSTTTFVNASDSKLPVGYYIMFSKTGNRTYTASDEGYPPVTATLNVANNSLNLQNIALKSAEFSGTPTSYNIHVMVNNQVVKTFAVSNIGTAQGQFHIWTIDAPPISTAPAAPSMGAPLLQIQCVNLSPFDVSAMGNAGTKCANSAAPSLAPYAASAWTPIANYPPGFVYDNLLAMDRSTGKVYSFGGVIPGGRTNQGFVYDPEITLWSSVAPMPTALARPAGAFVGGKLYITDGWPTGAQTSAQLSIYDPTTNTWTTGANNPAPLGGGAVAVSLGNLLYVIGGCPGSATCGANTVEIYNPATNAWSPGAPYPTTISYQACGPINGKIYCAGGVVNNTTVTKAGYVYDPTTNAWSPIASLPYENWGMAFMSNEQGLLLSQGIINGFGTVTNQGEIYTPGSNSWAPLPNALTAAYRMGGTCGFYTVGGYKNFFTKYSSGELLAGYEPCGYSVIPWLTIAPVSGTVAAGKTANVQLTFDGTGKKEFTTSKAQMFLTGTGPYGNEDVPLTVTWDPQPVDLVVAVQSIPASVKKGGEVFYNVTVTNRVQSNHGAATNVLLSVPVPTGATYISQIGNNCQESSGTVSCALGDLALGATDKVTFLMQLTQAGVIKPTFTATANEPQSPPGDNVATAQTTVIGTADLNVASFTNPNPINSGGVTTAVLTLGNSGPDTATGVSVKVQSLGNVLAIESGSASNGNCSVASGVLSCSLGDLPSGGTETVDVKVKARQPGQGVLSAQATTSATDPDMSNNSGQTIVTVNITSGGGGIALPTLAILLALALLMVGLGRSGVKPVGKGR